jgi:hypothetical protein
VAGLRSRTSGVIVVVLLLATGFVGSGHEVAQAVDDVSPPVLESVSLSRTGVDVRIPADPELVPWITVGATDGTTFDLDVRFVPPAHGGASFPVLDDSDGVLTRTGPLLFDETTPAGVQRFGLVLSDGVNTIEWTADELAAAGFPSSVTVISAYAEGTVPDDGGTVSTGGDPIPESPVVTEVYSPMANLIRITQEAQSSFARPGYVAFGPEIDISATPGSASDPIALRFRIHESTLTQLGSLSSLLVFRDSDEPVAACANPTQRAASPDPCIFLREYEAGGGAVIGIYTSHASTWNFGRRITAFSIITPTLPTGSLGRSYTATLQAINGTTPYKWKKLTKLPKGLKLRPKTGMILGTPKLRGTFSFTVQVSDKRTPKPRRVTTKSFTIRIT